MKKKRTPDGNPPLRLFYFIRRVFAFVVSMPFSLVLGFGFTVAIAAATFIEAIHGTPAARVLVYNARWLEILLLLIGINLTASIVKYRMWRKGKRMVFLFHLAFLLILLGAGITRYFGHEGIMHIREGGLSNAILSEKTYISVSLKSGDQNIPYEKPVLFSEVTKNRFNRTWRLNGRSVRLSLIDRIPGAGKKLVPDETGKPGISLVVLEGDQSATRVMLESESADWKNVHFVFGDSYPDSSTGTVVRIRIRRDGPVFSTPLPVRVMDMASRNQKSFQPGQSIALVPYSVYTLGNIRFVLEQFVPGGRIEAVRPDKTQKQDESDRKLQDALVFEAAVSGRVRTVSVFGLPGETGMEERLNLDGVDVGLAYGSKEIFFSFGLKLNDFRIDRYPGSMKPAGFTSDVTVVDRSENLEKPYSIFMNHILRYKGYRFYQSSYDEDEMGTVLSVSRDPGMVPTYIGYALLGLGLTFGLFRPKSRFRVLGQNIKKTAMNGFIAVSAFALFWSTGETRAFDGANSLGALDNAQCRRFAGVAVQDNGRIKPVHSLAKELIRSENRLKGLSGINADRVGLWAFAFPEEAGPSGYFQNSQPEKMFRLFPVVNDPLHSWVTVDEAGKRMDTEDKAFVLRWTDAYRKSVRENDRTKADSLLTLLEGFQATRGRDVFPGALRLNAEVLYNRADVFALSASVLFWAGLLMLVGCILRVVNPRWIWKPANAFLAVVLVLGFVFQTGGTGLRWFVSEHAPWTNKYESMVFIAWSVMFAGMLFGLKNRFMLAGAGILSGVFLCVAGMDWIDPKITTLPPVLKSIWLVIHVSVITSSYGFLGLGAVLALFNLLLLAFQTKKAVRTIRSIVAYETLAIERISLLGLMLLTLGNFLGAVWANESWGRYWGWDPKETWTLVTILVYSLVLHLRLVPKLGGTVLFNVASLFAFGSVLMTYFGVNLYLSGMHSYASGERPGFPAMAFVVAGVFTAISGIAWIKGKKVFT